MKNIKCPVCKSNNHDRLFPEYKGQALSSDWYLHNDVEIYNACCKSCGLIYEANGVRRFSTDFYEKVFKPKPMMKVFKKNNIISRQDNAYSLLNECINISKGGNLLEAGAGMGGFSKMFSETHPDWQVDSFEPSASFELLEKKAKEIDNLKVQRSGYEDVDIEDDSKDIIVSLGVLEHVDNPASMLKWASKGLKDGGYLFLEVPNFEHQPNDLLCVDHLSKLTVDSMNNLAVYCSMKVLKVIKQGVPAYFLMQKDNEVKPTLHNCYEQNIVTARENEQIVKDTMEAIKEARKKANEVGEAFGIFGLATAGLMAPYYLNFDPNDITAFIDENEALWNTEIFERPVGGLDLIIDKKIKHIALAISPAYMNVVKEKLIKYDIQIYSA